MVKLGDSEMQWCAQADTDKTSFEITTSESSYYDSQLQMYKHTWKWTIVSPQQFQSSGIYIFNCSKWDDPQQSDEMYKVNIDFLYSEECYSSVLRA